MPYDTSRPIAIYAEGAFGRGRSKTADGVIRYGKFPIVGVIDSTQAGKTADQVIGWGKGVPILASIDEALAKKPAALLIGIAPPGGKLPAPWRADVVKALENGVDIINGLHEIFNQDAQFAALAKKHGRLIWDVREPAREYPIACGRAAEVGAQVLLTVGTDCALGKMTLLLEMQDALEKAGRKPVFVATGQTGIMISGFGEPIDRVIGDFAAGAAELLVVENAPGHDLVLVEGQGSLIHPGFSGVTLALLHGSAPSHLILCHDPKRARVRDSKVEIPRLDVMVRMYEDMARTIRPAKTIGISLNTSGMEPAAAVDAVKRAEDETGLPATDPIRHGVEKLVAAVNDSYRAWKR